MNVPSIAWGCAVPRNEADAWQLRFGIPVGSSRRSPLISRLSKRHTCWKNWNAWSEAAPELETPGGTVNARVLRVVDAPAWIAEVGGFG